ncbi:MAG: hypothetical protein IID32_10180 [Planctomycetes bacterium]|nr:hypothetical protein [Planctomycetota bacterium]
MESKRSVLIVEDEPKIRSGSRDFLEYHGYEGADNYQQAIAQRITS